MLDLYRELIGFTIILFLALVYLLNKMLFVPLLGLMRDRSDAINNEMKQVDELEAEASALLSEAQAILEKAKEEAAALRSKVIEEQTAIRLQKIESLKKEKEKEYQTFLQELDKEAVELKNELLSQMPLFKESIKAKFAKL